jgi:hypothetical protein
VDFADFVRLRRSGDPRAYPQPGPSPAPAPPAPRTITPQPTGRPAATPGSGPAFAQMLANRMAGTGAVPIRAGQPDVCFPDGTCIPYDYAVAIGLVPPA